MQVLLTGISRGIGAAIAQQMLSEGHHVAGCARNADDLHQFQSRIPEGQHPLLHTQTCDVSHPGQTVQWCQSLFDAGWRPDVLILNAGWYAEDAVMDLNAETLNRQLGANFMHAPALLGFWMEKLRAEARFFRIVVMGSVVSEAPRAHAASYSLAKTMLDTYGRMLAETLRPLGIPLSRIRLGSVNTSSWGDAPVPRERFVQPEDVAAAVSFLCTLPPSAWVEELVLRPLDSNW